MKAKSAFPNAGQTLTTVGSVDAAGLGEHVSPFAPMQWELVLQTLRKIPAVGEAMGVAGGRKVILIQSVSKK